MGRFYEVRGEQKIEDGHWVDAETAEDKKYHEKAPEAEKLTIQKIRKSFVEI